MRRLHLKIAEWNSLQKLDAIFQEKKEKPRTLSKNMGKAFRDKPQRNKQQARPHYHKSKWNNN